MKINIMTDELYPYLYPQEYGKEIEVSKKEYKRIIREQKRFERYQSMLEKLVHYTIEKELAHAKAL